MTSKIKCRISIAVKGAKQEFAEGMGPGVLITQEITFKAPETDWQRTQAATLLSDAARVLIDDAIIIQYEVIE